MSPVLANERRRGLGNRAPASVFWKEERKYKEGGKEERKEISGGKAAWVTVKERGELERRTTPSSWNLVKNEGPSSLEALE